MNHRFNINLPEETIRMIDILIQDKEFSENIVRNRADFINEAIQYYIQHKIEQKALTHLRKRLKEGAIHRSQRDLELAEKWYNFPE